MNSIPFGCLLLVFTLVSCESKPRPIRSQEAPTQVKRDKLGGVNSLAQVKVTTTGAGVGVVGTTIDGRRVKGEGRTTAEAMDKLGTAAENTR